MYSAVSVGTETALAAGLAAGAAAQSYGLGRVAMPAEMAAWDIDVRSDGMGLPDGRGNVIAGAVTAAEPAPVAKATPEPVAGPVVDPALAAAGAKLFKKCHACHAIGDGAKHKVGPHLNGVFGRTAGSVGGFKYSNAMVRVGKSGLTWTLESLHAYLENPKALVSQTNMRFRGIKNADDREAVIAYLRRFSDDPRDIPEVAPTKPPTDHRVDPVILAIEGDPDYGEYLASECVTCHRRDGVDEGIPSITNWPAADFVTAMHAYKDAVRPDPVMRMVAGRLSNEEIASLAAYFASLDFIEP